MIKFCVHWIQRKGEESVKGPKRKYLDFIDILLEARVRKRVVETYHSFAYTQAFPGCVRLMVQH